MSTDEFMVGFGVFDTAGLVHEPDGRSHAVQISLSAGGRIFGSCSGLSVDGEVEFAGIRILSKGVFVIIAQSEDMVMGVSSEVTVETTLYSITITTDPVSPTSYFNFQIFISTKSEDNELYLPQSQVSITLSQNSQTLASNSLRTQSGRGSLSLYSSTSGLTEIQASSNSITSSLSITLQKPILKIQEIFPVIQPGQSILTSQELSIKISVFDSTSSKIESSNGIHSIFLTLSDPSALIGNPVLSTVSGVALFTGIRIKKQGNFRILASADDMVQVQSDLVSVQSVLNYFIVSSSETSPSANFYFTITVSLMTEDGRLFDKDSRVNLVEASKTIKGSMSVMSKNGIALFDVYFLNQGRKSIQVVSGLVSQEFVIEVLQLKLVVDNLKNSVRFMQPATSLDKFSVTVFVYDSALGFKETRFGEYLVSLSIQSPGKLLGLTSKTSKNGEVVFIDLRIISSGSFNIKASCAGLGSGESSSIQVSALPFKLTAVAPTSRLSPYFSFEISLEVKSEDLNLLVDPCTVQVSERQSQVFVGDSSVSISSGTGSYSLYFTTSGNKSLKFSIQSLNFYLDLIIEKLVVKISKIDPIVSFIQPSTSSDFFSVFIQILDCEGKMIEKLNGAYNVQLKLSDNGVIFGNNEILTVQGSGSINGLKILSNGNFSLSPTASGLDSIEFKGLEIRNKIKFFNLIMQSIGKAGFVFALSVEVFGDDDELFKNLALVQISSNYTKIGGVLEKSIETGFANFSLYFDEPGFYLINVKIEGLSRNGVVEIRKNANPDPLCYEPLDESTCSVCVDNAKVVKGVCSCIENSRFSKNDKFCVCESSYVLTNGFCIKCGNFFKKAEITATLLADYQSIQVTFNRSVSPPSSSLCSSYLSLGVCFTYTCIWESSQSLKVHHSCPSLPSSLTLDPVLIQASGSLCTKDIQSLALSLSLPSSISSPKTCLSSPDSFFIQCSSPYLSIFSSCPDPHSLYSWSVSSPSLTDSLSALVQNSTGNLVNLPSSLLNPGTYSFTLLVKHKFFNLLSQETKNIKVINETGFTVELSSGNYAQIKRNLKFFTSVIVKSCESEDWNYELKVLDGPKTLELEDLIVFEQGMMTVPALALQGGKVYKFLIEVQGTSMKGSAELELEVLESELVVEFSRSNGVVSSKIEFEVEVIAKDIDNSQETFEYFWTCTSNNEVCRDKEGFIVVWNQISSKLNLAKGKLLNTQKYFLTVEVKAKESGKQVKRTLEITASDEKNGEIILKPVSDKVNPKKVFRIAPGVQSSSLLQFKWTLTQEDQEFLYESSYSYLSLKKDLLGFGMSYILKLEIIEGSEGIYSNLVISTNDAPSCSGLNVKEKDGLSIVTVFDCFDEDFDTPLIYQFSVEIKDKFVYLNSPVLAPIVKKRIPELSSKVKVKVCDSLDLCSEYEELLENVGGRDRRLMNSSDYVELFLLESKNYDDLPISFINYVAKVTEYEDFLVIYEKFLEHFSGLSSNLYNLDLLLSCLEIYFTIPTTFIQSSSNSTYLLTYTFISSLQSEITESQGESLVKSLSNLKPYLSLNQIFPFCHQITKLMLQNSYPSTSLSLQSSISIYLSRSHLNTLSKTSLKTSSFSIQIPDLSSFSNISIYDFELIYFELNQKLLISIQVYSGSEYKDYTLTSTNQSRLDFYLSSPIKLELKSDTRKSITDCVALGSEGWNKEICTNENGQVSIYTSGYLQLDSNDDTSKAFVYVLIQGAIAAVLLFLALGTLALLKWDKGLVYDTQDKKNFWTIYPVSSLMISQAKPWRFLISIKLLSSSLLLGLVCYLVEFWIMEKILIEGVGQQMIPMLCAELVNSGLTFLNFKYLKNKKFFCVSLGAHLSVLVGSAGALAYLLYNYPKSSNSWVELYLVSLFGFVFILNPVTSFLFKFMSQSRISSTLPIRHSNSASVNDESNILKEGAQDETIFYDAGLYKSKTKEIKSLTSRPVNQSSSYAYSKTLAK